MRPGHVVLMKLPGHSGTSSAVAQIGMVLTVWKGVKAPKPCSSEVPINGCVAFRAVCLEPASHAQDCSGVGDACIYIYIYKHIDGHLCIDMHTYSIYVHKYI